MAITNITNADDAKQVLFPRDAIVWPSVLEEVIGGVTVGLPDGYPLTAINSGQIVLKETATGGYSLMPITVTADVPAYDALPSGFTYAGLVRATKLIDDPFVSIVYAGTANDKAMIVPIADAMKTAISTAFPKLTFKAD